MIKNIEQITQDDEREFEEWLKDRLNDQTVNLMPKAVWLASRRTLRQRRASEIADSFPCATIDEGEGE